MGSLPLRLSFAGLALLLVLLAAFAVGVALLVWPDLLPMALGRPRVV